MKLSSIILFNIFISFYIIPSHDASKTGKQKTAVIDDIVDIKEFKKLLRTKTNILVCFISYPSSETTNIVKAFKEAAVIIKGHGTMVLVDCVGETKKMCRKLKVNQHEPFSLKHYRDGEYHKDYDRRDTTSSIVNFMRDPTGGLPWEEDPTASDVVHLPDAQSITRFLKKGPALNRPSMVMFYAPWCGYCKTLKPEYANAASDLRGEAFLAAIDVARPENSGVRQQYNITGFPTLLFYENGKMKFPYEGDNNRAALVEFMRDPQPFHKSSLKAQVPKEKDWALTVSDVVHLTSDTFDPMLVDESCALVVFHAPWCGHCKRIKPEYERAATLLKDRGINGMLAAVDATKEPELASKYGVKGYPTIKYFTHGEFKYDISARDEMKIIEFMKNPQAPPPPPPPEPVWSDEESHVVHLLKDNFRSLLKKKKHAFIMFYAPWCGHCKRAKPEMVKLADNLKEDSRTIVGAVDCTQDQSLCQEYEIKGYPTIKYFSFYDKVRADYNGGRTETEMTNFLKDPPTATASNFSMPVATDDDDDEDTAVVTLTETNFVEGISSTPTLVMFYAPWCGHCKKMKPAFKAASLQAKKEKFSVKLGMVDCTTNPELASQYGVASYPQIKLFNKGSYVEDYSAGRTEDEFISYLRNQHMKKSIKEEL